MPPLTLLSCRTGDRPRGSSRSRCQTNDEVNDFLTRIDFISYEGFGFGEGVGGPELGAAVENRSRGRYPGNRAEVRSPKATRTTHTVAHNATHRFGSPLETVSEALSRNTLAHNIGGLTDALAATTSKGPVANGC
jgi:hypothetical protein